MSQQGTLASTGGGSGTLDTLTGNTGGAVGPDGADNINILGAAPISVAGNPGTNTLTIDTDGTLAITYTEDTGTATPAADNLNVLGDATQGSVTSGAGSTITITNSDASETQKGVSELATDAEAIAGTDTVRTIVPSSLGAKLGAQTANSVPFGAGTAAAIGWTSALTDGQLVIGATGGAPAAGAITSVGGTITVSLGTNTINLETNGSAVGETITGDSGGALSPTAGNWNILGGTAVAGTTPLVTSGSVSTLTINAQISQALASADATKIGMANFDSSSFSVDADGFVTFVGNAFIWTEVTMDTSMAVNTGYIANKAGTACAFTLPSSAAVGDIIRVTGKSSTGWTLAQNAGQTLHFGSVNTTTGAGGSLASTDQYDSFEVVCITTDTDFNVLSSIGNITIV